VGSSALNFANWTQSACQLETCLVDEFGRPSMPQGLIVGFYFLSEDVVVVLVLIVTF